MATEPQAISISLSPEVKGLLADNGIDLVSALRADRLDVVRADFSAPSGDGLKSVELIILASAVAAPLVGSSIVRILDALGRGKRGKLTVSELPNKASGASSSHTLKGSFLGLQFEMTDAYDE